MTEEEREQELVALAKIDYDAALRTMSGFVTAGGQIRGIGIAAWTVVFGLAVRDESYALAALSFVVVLIFWYADAYHMALYRRGLSRSIQLETLLDEYAARLGIDAEDPRAVNRFRARLESHSFGMHRTLRPIRLRDFGRLTPKVVFRLIYPSVAVTSLVTAVLYIT
ncbi:MAG: hypothetical protein AVDCRST_MAG85-4334 [uncultured Solirubrobacteraceae bacterium]|uniref:SMODS and SLOG-associating 2TM effector domain-containing protein n=1 Tax=uncultured Solirubrobacteraceae bacterium TaxID=1162706 RepID=A0A6J4U2A3_9ACTN|nr:MAG: hypothetical protein AVDCRST_MAG85-4334 [uncultured Solirubrobacteraceae bacterium]